MKKGKVYILFILIFLLMGFSKCSTEKVVPEPVPVPDKPAITYIGTASPQIIILTVRAGKRVPGMQEYYKAQSGDQAVTEGHNIWLTRNGKRIGSLVGPAQKLLMPFDSVSGEKLDTVQADNQASYIIKSEDDSGYSQGLMPQAVYRKSKPFDLARLSSDFDAPQEHNLYLKLPASLKVGNHYSIEFKGLPFAVATFTYDPMKNRSEAVHVSHIGFRPDDPVKIAFLSLWMGSGGGLEYSNDTKFHIINEKTGDDKLNGKITISKLRNSSYEDSSGKNFNETDVYILDFSPLKDEGVYRACVEGVGCSYPFEIGKDSWRKAFYTSVRGLFHQRSGIALGPPFTTYKRPRNFHPGDGFKVFASTLTLMDSGNGISNKGFDKLKEGKTAEIVADAWGGYADAGDWDRRIQHLDAARYLLELDLFFPKYFEGVNLNIPESNDNIPDIVNEALWGVDFYRRLQTKEGGIRGGIESESHPRYGEASWQESLSIMAYAPDVWSSYLYAGVAAKTAFWFKKKNVKLSALYEESALRAMNWAEKEMKAGAAVNVHEIKDARNLAAIELFRLTGDKHWHDIFVEKTVFTDPKNSVYKHNSHSQSDAAWVYVTTEREGMNSGLKKNCREAIIREAKRRIEAQQIAAFRWMKDPYRPAFGGAFSVPDCVHAIYAHILTGDVNYLKAVILASQTGAGANPLNMSYTTGVGNKYPKNPLYFDSRVSLQEAPAGITVLGPADYSALDESSLYYHKLAGRYCYPEFNKWPVIESYWDVFWYPMMCEFSIQNNIAPNAFVWGYLAAQGVK